MGSGRRGRKTSPPVPRKQPRQGRAAVTVEAMVTAVERVLEQHGAAGLTTNRVAEVAGVSVGTLYQYFPNKEAMVGALQERVLQQITAVVRAVLVAAETVPLAIVAERMGAGLVALYRSHRPMHPWLHELRTAAAYQQRFRQVTDTLVDELAAFLARRADLQLTDPRASAFALLHAVEGVAVAVSARPGQVDVEAVNREAVRMVIAYTTRPPQEGATEG